MINLPSTRRSGRATLAPRPAGGGGGAPGPAARLIVALLDTDLPWIRMVAVTAGAVAIGGLAVYAPLLGGGVAMAAIALLLVCLGEGLTRLFVAGLGIVLIGYAFLGKSFAYIGVAPLYIGEALLGLAVLSLVITVWRARLSLIHWLLFLFMAWGALRTIPFIERDGIDALRDGVLWGYAIFAIAVSFAVRADDFLRIVTWYRRVLPWFVAWVPVAAVLSATVEPSLPRIPGTDLSVLIFKGGDMCVHLVGGAAFVLLGLYATGSRPHAGVWLWPIWFGGVALSGTVNRGGLVTVLIGVTVVCLLRPSRRVFPFVATAVILLGLLAIVDPEIKFSNDRKVSVTQLITNVLSIRGDSNDDGLEGTKEYRQAWWGKIIDYTVHGPYFWGGKGFGVNLGDADGFQLDPTHLHLLRAPHNSHVTILARAGVPGLAIWIVLQLVFSLSLLAAFYRALRARATFVAQLAGWLLVYWLAMTLNTSFDPYFEGPQGGIWFWTIFGLGLVVIKLPLRPDPTPSDDQQAATARPARPQ